MLFPVEQKEILRAYEEFSDIPESCAVAVYSLNEIATEKVVALGDRARNEPRDLYDPGSSRPTQALNSNRCCLQSRRNSASATRRLPAYKIELLPKKPVSKLYGIVGLAIRWRPYLSLPCAGVLGSLAAIAPSRHTSGPPHCLVSQAPRGAQAGGGQRPFRPGRCASAPGLESRADCVHTQSYGHAGAPLA